MTRRRGRGHVASRHRQRWRGLAAHRVRGQRHRATVGAARAAPRECRRVGRRGRSSRARKPLESRSLASGSSPGGTARRPASPSRQSMPPLPCVRGRRVQAGLRLRAAAAGEVRVFSSSCPQARAAAHAGRIAPRARVSARPSTQATPPVWAGCPALRHRLPRCAGQRRVPARTPWATSSAPPPPAPREVRPGRSASCGGRGHCRRGAPPCRRGGARRGHPAPTPSRRAQRVAPPSRSGGECRCLTRQTRHPHPQSSPSPATPCRERAGRA